MGGLFSKPKTPKAPVQAIPPVSATAKEVVSAQRDTILAENKKKGISSTILSQKKPTAFGEASKMGGW